LAVASKKIYLEWYVVHRISLCELEAGNNLAAQSNAQRCQKLARLEGNMIHESFVLEVEAVVYWRIGAHKKTIALCTQARELLCQCGMKGSDADYNLLCIMGMTYYLKSEYSGDLYADQECNI
jgi:hypothetical protein